MGTVISQDGKFEWEERTRIISARLAEPLERERYDENYQKQIAGNE
jgi:uncharacterized DUF497 family protein